MKLQKVLLLLICVVAILFAFPLSVGAIDFKAEEKYNSVFVVTSGNALGSGFAIGENCIVTNAHVVHDPEDVVLTTYDGKTHSAYLAGIDQDKDIAILVVDAKFTPLKVADYKSLNTGDDVYAIGAPKSMAYTLTKGVISAKERKIGDYTYIQTDAAINEGNSGGPLLNKEGSVIGINTLKMLDSEGIGLAIPMTVVSEFVKSLNIEIDENGNVSKTIVDDKKGSQEETTVKKEENTQNKTKNPDKKEENNKPEFLKKLEKMDFTVIALLAGLGISVVINIVLFIMLIFQQRKNLNLKYDPRERTDFDIDILE